MVRRPSSGAIRSSVRSVRDEFLRRTGEPALSAYYAAYSEHRGEARYILKHLVDSVSALVAVGRLPKRSAVLGTSLEAAAIRQAVSAVSGLFGVRCLSTGQAVLDIPETVEEYLTGARKQTLRRKIRASRRAGTTWRPVLDRAERLHLLALADEAERNHPDEQYRKAHPDNRDVLAYDLWLAAYSSEGEPLLLSVTPTHGEWAWLRYFRTLGTGPQYSDSRYLMYEALVEQLAARGVRHLFDASNPIGLPEGLRHFQRMVGFRLAHVTMSDGGMRSSDRR